MTTNDFIQQCKDSKTFDCYQIQQIRAGFENGLSMEQIELYAKSEFDWEQMFEIRWSFQYSGLIIEQVRLYANPEFNADQMNQIREFIKENNITDMSINTIKFLIGIDYI